MSVMREVDSAIKPSPAPRPARRHQLLLRTLAISLAYLAVYLLFDYCASRNHGAMAISSWSLSQGIVLGLLVIGGLAYTPAVFLGSLIGGLVCWRFSPVVSVGLAVSVTLGYALAATVLRRVVRIDPRLARLRDAFNLLLVALAAPLPTAALAALTFALTRRISWGEYGGALTAWWYGDLIGLFSVTPFILVHGAPWARALIRSAARLGGGGLAEQDAETEAVPRVTLQGLFSVVLWAAIIAGTIWLTMLSPMAVSRYFYLAFLVIIWIALQHGMRGTSAGVMAFSLGTLAAMLITTLLTLHPVLKHRFEYLAGENAIAVTELQIFIFVLAVTGLLLGAVVSERRRTEQAVRDNEELLRTFIDAMPDMVVFKDGEGRWLSANNFGLRLFQFDGAPYYGKTNAELAEANPLFRDVLLDGERTDEQAWEQGSPSRDEEVIPQPDGNQMTFDIIKVPLLHPDGRRKGLVVIGRDITERTLAEEALDRERAYLSSAIDILPLPLAFLAPNGEWTQANAASYAFARGLLPRQWLDGQMLTPDTRMLIPREERPAMRSLEEVVPTSTEVILILPDGREVPMLVHSGPVTVNGKLVAVVAAFQDITAIREADRAKDEFLGILSHELLTPLTDALGWTQAARETPDSTPQALDIIEHNVRLLHRVMTDLLDLSRIIHGKLYLSREVADLWKLTEGYAAEFEPIANGRRRTLVLESPDEAMPVSLDRERLRQVLITLFDNALKGTDPGDRIIITGRTEGDTAVLVIRDTGHGMPQEMLDHLFTPFYQPHPVEPGRGMGLGLSLVKGLIELHGGRISADSSGLNQGTIFTIELPLRMDD